MIAELFYPKELKEIITDLRADDNLNTDALKNVNREILRQRSTMFAHDYYIIMYFHIPFS